jgi:hypothetical protein
MVGYRSVEVAQRQVGRIEGSLENWQILAAESLVAGPEDWENLLVVRLED